MRYKTGPLAAPRVPRQQVPTTAFIHPTSTCVSFEDPEIDLVSLSMACLAKYAIVQERADATAPEGWLDVQAFEEQSAWDTVIGGENDRSHELLVVDGHEHEDMWIVE